MKYSKIQGRQNLVEIRLIGAQRAINIRCTENAVNEENVGWDALKSIF